MNPAHELNLASSEPAPADTPADLEELLAAMAAGELDQLPEHKRQLALEAVARDPELGAVVLQTQRALEAGLAAPRLTLTDTPPAPQTQPQTTPQKRGGGPILFSFVSAGWALAACLTLAFGTIHFMQPPPDTFVPNPGQHQTTPTMLHDADSPGIAWHVFIASAAATGVLTLSLGWCVLRRKSRRA